MFAKCYVGFDCFDSAPLLSSKEKTGQKETCRIEISVRDIYGVQTDTCSSYLFAPEENLYLDEPSTAPHIDMSSQVFFTKKPLALSNAFYAFTFQDRYFEQTVGAIEPQKITESSK